MKGRWAAAAPHPGNEASRDGTALGSGRSFSGDVPLHEGLRTLTAAAQDIAGNVGMASVSALVVPRGAGCAAAAAGRDEVLVMCNAGADSWVMRATLRGIGGETLVPGTNRVRPPILFANEGTLFEVAMVLETSGRSEKLIWSWGPWRR